MKRKDRFRIVCIGMLFLGWMGICALGTDETVLSILPSDPIDEQTQELSLDQELRQTVDALRESQLLQTLDLPEERAHRLLETLRNVRQIRQDYQIQRGDIEHQLETLLQVVPPDQARIQQVLQKLETTNARYYHQVLQADQALWGILSTEEQARYILFQRHFTQQLQEMIAKIRQERVPKPTPSQFNFLLRRQDEESVIRQPR